MTGASRSAHITPQLIQLHWLPVPYRVRYKTLLTTYKALHGLAPQYLSSLLQFYTPGRPLRSGDQNLLVVPTYRLKSFGGRTFASTAPRLWNELPGHMQNIERLAQFKTALKTHLFKLAFNLWLTWCLVQYWFSNWLLIQLVIIISMNCCHSSAFSTLIFYQLLF